MDRLHCFHVFIEVARGGSFSGAASRLGLSRASVTKHVASLEVQLGARLLNRTTQQVRLTEAGIAALATGKALLEQYEFLEADIRSALRGPRGVIRVGTPPSFGTWHLVPIVIAFVKQHPDMQIVLSADEGDANLVTQGLDLTVRIARSLEDASYVAQTLVKAPQVLVATPGYLDGHGRPRTPHDLTQHNCLINLNKAPLNVWTFTGPDGAVSVKVHGSLQSDFGEPLHQAARLGHGISVHPIYMVNDDLASGRLDVVLQDYMPPSLDIYVIYSSRFGLPSRVRLFLNYMKEWAETPPTWSRTQKGADVGQAEQLGDVPPVLIRLSPKPTTCSGF